MITFLALVHMLNVTQLVWGGWGQGMITFLALVHMLNATQLVWGGWGEGMITFLALVHMYDMRLDNDMFRRNADNVWHGTGQLCKG